jgi:hypothetical protein
MPSPQGTGFIRVARGTATAVVACVAALLLPVLSGAPSAGRPAWHAAAGVLPQAMALALPMGFLMSTVFYAAGARMSVRLAMALVLVSVFVALAASANFALLVPWANQMAPARPGVAREPHELFPRQLRAERDTAARSGDRDRVREFDVYVHSRWAFSGASMVFAVAALALTAGRARTLVHLTFLMAVMVGLYYVAWRLALSTALSGRVPAWAATWSPNAAVLLAAGVIAAGRGQRRGSRARGDTQSRLSRSGSAHHAAGARRPGRRRGLPITRRHEGRR